LHEPELGAEPAAEAKMGGAVTGQSVDDSRRLAAE
jgi:hypothetical protein